MKGPVIVGYGLEERYIVEDENDVFKGFLNANKYNYHRALQFLRDYYPKGYKLRKAKAYQKRKKKNEPIYRRNAGIKSRTTK